jgi:glycosyltransferase involved in cell wall biosynthesis
MKSKVAKFAIIVKGYPRISETFIAQEILGLEQQGLNVHIFSLRHPTDPVRHPVHAQIKAPITYLPEYLHEEPLRLLRALARQCLRPSFWRVLYAGWQDLQADFTRNRCRRLGQALVLASELPAGISVLYCHFLHTPGSVACYTSGLTGLPWCASAHARDIWTTPAAELRQKLAAARWVTTCSQAACDYLRTLTHTPERIHLNYHGLDLDRFPPRQGAEGPVNGDGRDPAHAVRLLTVARAVPKKGLDLLLRALAGLPHNLHWQWVHIGGGAELQRLQALARELSLSDERIRWQGPQPQSVVLAACREADLFVLPCRIDSQGDRDGLPNVLMEAQSQRLACLSTRVSGIPELIQHQKTGWLVPPDSLQELRQALVMLIKAPDTRQQLAGAGLQRLCRHFSHVTAIREITQLLTGLLDEAAV